VVETKGENKNINGEYKIVIIAILLICACFFTYYFHFILNTEIVFTHFFYIPIILSVLWWRKSGLLVALFLGMLILFSHFFWLGEATEITSDIIRAVMFIVVALTTFVLNEKRRKAEERLRQKKELLDNICGSVYAGIALLNENDEILYSNKIAEKMFGYSKSQIVGLKLNANLSEEDYQKYKKTTKALKAINGSFDAGKVIELFIKPKNKKEFPVEFSISKAKIKQENDIIITIKDISERKKIDQAKTDFVFLASHQLRTPLSIIVWQIEMLLTEHTFGFNKKQKKYLKEIYSAAERMTNLVNTLLNVSRIELGVFAIEPRMINIFKISDNVLDKFSKDIKNKQIKIEKIYDRSLQDINIDPNLIRIIFQNLISNAIKYSPDKSKISIDIKKQVKNLLIKIEDRGYGIPKDQQSKVFTKLFRARNIRSKESEGVGLGLYVIKSIVDELKGKIWFKSVENKGTIFYISIPLIGMKKKKGVKSLGRFY